MSKSEVRPGRTVVMGVERPRMPYDSLDRIHQYRAARSACKDLAVLLRKLSIRIEADWNSFDDMWYR